MVEIACRIVAGGIEIVIDDTGEGLPAGDVESLFEPFCSHKPGGTGLGLAIARRLARRLGGEVSLAPRPEGGARARLVLSDSFAEEERRQAA